MEALLKYFSIPINIYFLIFISFLTASIILISREIGPLKNYIIKLKNLNMNSLLFKYTKSEKKDPSRVLNDDEI